MLPSVHSRHKTDIAFASIDYKSAVSSLGCAVERGVKLSCMLFLILLRCINSCKK